MHPHTIEFRIQKYKLPTTSDSSWKYKAYLTPNYSKETLSELGPYDSLDELAKSLATRGGKKSTYKFIPFTKPEEQVVQTSHDGKRYIESTMSTDELEELVDLFYKYKFGKNLRYPSL